MGRKSELGGGGWVHPKGANSMAMFSVKVLLVDNKRAIETSHHTLYGLCLQHSRSIFTYAMLEFPKNLDCKFVSW